MNVATKKELGGTEKKRTSMENPAESMRFYMIFAYVHIFSYMFAYILF